MPESKTVPVVVVDDHPLFRRGLVELVNDSDFFNIAADFDNGLDFFNALSSLSVELLLLDLHMPNISGLEILKKIKLLREDIKVVIITASEDQAELFDAITAGANGYLLKDSNPDQILKKLISVINGDIAIDSEGINMLARHISTHHEVTTDVVTTHSLLELTERERQTLKLITQGMSNKLIARELGISDGTVKVYVKNLLRKLNLGSRLELAAWANSNATVFLE
ncbi:MAG: response regulator [Marinomonas sp.]